MVACTFLYAIQPYVIADQATIPHLKEEIQGYLLIKKILNFYLEITIFKHVFESCRPPQNPATFWSVTQSLLVRYQATIPPVEEDTEGFHMNPNA